MEKEIRKLAIKAFHINKVQFNAKTYIENNVLHIRESLQDTLIGEDDRYIKKAEIRIIYPDNHDMFVNSIMDFCPIAAKVLGKLGEGVTHTLTGVYVMLTGADEKGVQVAEFGSSEGILKDQVVFGRMGTPGINDIIIHVDLMLKDGMGTVRPAITASHRVCEKLVQEIRAPLKKMNGRLCDERHDYVDKVKYDKKRVVIIKQVAGQGAMYDTLLFAKEPGGLEGGRSIIDMGNVPMIVSPNEYRDGALRAMH